VGRNSAIKRFDSTPKGQSETLFRSVSGRLPVVLELLKSPWLVRASDIARPEDAGAGKRVNDVIAIAWDSRKRCPSAFEWRSRTYRIDAVVQTWAVERRWWEPGQRVSRRCWRVLARGGTYDIAFDRLEGTWSLLGILD
jgi:hypothetical protein